VPAPNFDLIPEELKDRKQWVLWRQITRAGKSTKVPFQPNGIEGDSSDPFTWSAYSDVVEAYEKGGYDGIGFVFDTQDPYAGVDLDHCVNEDGSIQPKAKTILERLNSYSETSPSGKGIKILVKAKNPTRIKNTKGYQQGFNYKKPEEGLEFEVYYGNRFFTLTGNILDQYSYDIESRNEELTEIFREVFKDRGYFDGDDHTVHSVDDDTGEPLSSDAAERLQELLAADPIFKTDLYTPAPVGKRSDAEFHLCARLWEAGFTEAEIHQIMTSSPQTKWAERDDSYRWGTIRNAVATAEASHQKKVDEEAKKEASKKAAPIGLTDVADIEYDKDGKIKKVRFSPTFAAHVVLERMPMVMAEDSEDIYHFNGQIYKPDGARIIDLALCEAATDHVTGNKLREVIRRIRNDLLSHPVVFDPDPYLLGVKNCVANLLTGEVREYRPEDLILDQIPVSFDPVARCPAFLAFLESITPNVSDRITLIDWFAATAIKEPLAYVLFLLGLGRNGKGIYEKLIKKFFGKTAFRDMPLAEVAKNNFAAGGFYRKRGWIASETGKRKASIGTDFIKLTSGNGSIDGDRKNQSRIQFEPYFQTTVDTNTMPKIEDSSIGWQERFVKIDLPFIFVANPDKANPLERQRDPALYDKLSNPSELSGILNLLLFRSKTIGKSGQIHKRAGSEMFAEYAEQSSSVTAFLDMFCEFIDEGIEFWTPSGPVYEAYCTWCGFKVGEVVDKAYFGRQLKKFCGGYAPKQPKDKDRKTITAYRGLNFDKTRYDSAIEALQKSMSKVCPKMSEACPRNEEEENSQTITMSEVSEVKMWIEIIERFGNPTKKENSPEKDGYEKIPRTLRTLRTSAPLEPMKEDPSLDKSRTLPRTETIEEQTKAKEVHFRKIAEEHAGKKPPLICDKCGEDLTGKGTVERGGKVYCAVVGCGYPARKDGKAEA
jgi:putative DNA primase/helicase